MLIHSCRNVNMIFRWLATTCLVNRQVRASKGTIITANIYSFSIKTLKTVHPWYDVCVLKDTNADQLQQSFRRQSIFLTVSMSPPLQIKMTFRSSTKEVSLSGSFRSNWYISKLSLGNRPEKTNRKVVDHFSRLDGEMESRFICSAAGAGQFHAVCYRESVGTGN